MYFVLWSDLRTHLSLRQSGENGGDPTTERYLTWADLACPLSVEPAFLLPLQAVLTQTK